MIKIHYRLIRALTVILALILLVLPSAYARPYIFQGPPQDLSFKHIQKPMPYFTGIDVRGNFQVNIRGHQSPPCLSLSGTAYAVNTVSAQVVNGTLQIRQAFSKKQPPPGRVTLTINLPGDLNRLITGGSTVVTGHNISSHGLSIIAQDQSAIYLDGEMRISHLQNNSSGPIKVYWVNNGDLLIDGSGSGPIYLAGTADVLTIHLGGNSQIDARQLRANEVYVTVQDYACARVTPLHSLYAFASDHGNVYYYHRPHLMAGNTRCSGNVLYMY